jgi:hypothetical protein
MRALMDWPSLIVAAVVVLVVVGVITTTVVMAAPPRNKSAAIPLEVRQVWLNPDQADAAMRGVRKGDALRYNRPFALTAVHLALLRKMQFSWDSGEGGAPRLNPKFPYGRPDLMKQLGETFGQQAPAILAMRHVEMTVALRVLLRHGKAASGRYPIANVTAAEIAKHLDQATAEAGFSADGRFTLTDEHARLLKALTIEWPDRTGEVTDSLAAGGFPSARGDSKRPYGDRSYFEYDMLEALGRPVTVKPDGQLADIPDAEAQRLMALHLQMLGALQVFVEHADIAPGTYD